MIASYRTYMPALFGATAGPLPPQVVSSPFATSHAIEPLKPGVGAAPALAAPLPGIAAAQRSEIRLPEYILVRQPYGGATASAVAPAAGSASGPASGAAPGPAENGTTPAGESGAETGTAPAPDPAEKENAAAGNNGNGPENANGSGRGLLYHLFGRG